VLELLARREFGVDADAVLAFDVLDEDGVRGGEDARVDTAQEPVVDPDVGDLSAPDRQDFLVERIFDGPLRVEQDQDARNLLVLRVRGLRGSRVFLGEYELGRDHFLGTVRVTCVRPLRLRLNLLMENAVGAAARRLDVAERRHEVVERGQRGDSGRRSGLVFGQRDRRGLDGVDALELLAELVALYAHAPQLLAYFRERAHRLLAARPKGFQALLLIGEQRLDGVASR
jgi:hypothetical protein